MLSLRVFISYLSLSYLILASAQCIVIGPVCGFVTAGGRCPNLIQPWRAQCLRLSERFFHSVLFFIVCVCCFYVIYGPCCLVLHNNSKPPRGVSRSDGGRTGGV